MGVLKQYNSDSIDWNIGALYAHDDYIQKLFIVMKELGLVNPIKYVFGTIPTVLVGGRVTPRDATMENAFKLIDRYNQLGVGCRLTFSSMYVTKDELKDSVSNQLMQHLEENNQKYGVRMNGIILTSELLGEYIYKTYNSLELISSQVKPSVEVGLGNDTVDYYNRLFDLFDIVVVNPNKWMDANIIHGLKHIDRVEFITNHRCFPDCPKAGEHYKAQVDLSKKMLSGEDCSLEEDKLDTINNWCLSVRQKFPLLGVSMSASEINLLINNGVKHFKLEGRDNDAFCFLRDVGDYIFNHQYFSRIAHSIMGEAI